METILVVDDEPKIASFVSRALIAHGYLVDTASDGMQGFRLACERAYDLIVLDLLLPGLDGISVLARLMELRPGQPVFVLSALSDVESKVRCLELGASDYLSKPFELAELMARVRSRLRGPATAPSERLLTVGGVTLDLRRRSVDVGSTRVALSAREFLLLEHLMRRNGEVCTREGLLASVWGYSFDPGTNVVDVYIGRLRSKLGSGVIETVRSVGYLIDAA